MPKQQPPLDEWIPQLISARGDKVDSVFNPLNFGGDDGGQLFLSLTEMASAEATYGAISELSNEQLKRLLIAAVWHVRMVRQRPGLNS